MTSISEDISGYTDVCNMFAEDDELFQKFKQNKTYQIVLEHVSQNQGQVYYNSLSETLKSELFRIKENDRLGSPATFVYEFGEYSPTSLRYAKVLDDLRKKCLIDQKRIVEIGAGYGGQYTVIRQYHKPLSYDFFDLAPVIKLIKKYVSQMRLEDIDVSYESILNRKVYRESYDLLISNYAISECDTQTQDYYIENIISKCKMGYITYNHQRGHSILDFIRKIEKAGKSVSVSEESPQTAPDNCMKNYVIEW